KHRFIGRAGGRHPHQILRVDREETADIGEDCAGRLGDQFEGVLAGCDALLVSDYAKGVCTPALVRPILDRARFRSIPVLVDPGRGRDPAGYRGATLFKPNRLEASALAGVAIQSPQEAVRVAQILRHRVNADVVAVTLDGDGIAFAAADASGVVPTAPREAHDITGAGDMVLAALGVGFAVGWPLHDALRIANAAAGLEIERLGIAPVTWPEIVAALAPRPNPASERKVCTLGEVSAIAARFRQAGRTIAFTNGCFDLLHAGHLATLEFAAARADLLVVGLNSDASVRRLKGPTRPLVPQAQRAALLAALGCVDHVVLFDDETPHRLLRALRPDVLIKGGSTGAIVGREVVEAAGGQALHAPLVEGLSTTRIVQQLREPETAPCASAGGLDR
ncbi:MAG: bifunctional heptose 7-phosphate kinase/heptose 1-phosphate adenyltransferase, partial [Pirellulales bacterium]|nr:bifunctional heptose 7-phosphate kinase/heptose 1-phosphate adenyltransferase [Pirellulales bacterium]